MSVPVSALRFTVSVDTDSLAGFETVVAAYYLKQSEPPTSLAELCARADCPLIHGAIAGWYGQVAVVQPGSGLLKRLYPDTGPGLEKELGTPPFTAALCASLMVAEGVKVLCDLAQHPSDQVAYVDLQAGSFWSVDMSI